MSYEAYPSVSIQREWDLSAIISMAGGTPEDSVVAGDRLYVPGVTQAALEGAAATYDHATASVAMQWEIVRAERDRRLRETDRTQLYDHPKRGLQEWVSYRQALRDLPQDQSDPFNITWPTKPTS